MDIFNVVTRSHICREFNCHKDTIKRWIKEEGFPELIQPRQTDKAEQLGLQGFVRLIT